MPYSLSVVFFAADPLTGRRSHWALFVHPPNNSTGIIYEAQGGLLQMTYGRIKKVTPSKDPTYRGQQELCQVEEDKIEEFEEATKETELPSSPLKVPPGYHRQDCQDWVRNVTRLAVERGVVPGDVEGKLDSIPRLILLGEEVL
jgi:Family of unknown function (DUF6540)